MWPVDSAQHQKPGNEQSSRNPASRHEELLCLANPSRSFRAVAVSSSGITLASARTGMKFVSPPQRGTRCRWMWSAIPAPAAFP